MQWWLFVVGGGLSVCKKRKYVPCSLRQEREEGEEEEEDEDIVVKTADLNSFHGRQRL